jgi:peptide chain release factor 1
MDPKLLKEYKDRFSKINKPKSSQDWEEFNRLQPIISKIDEIEKLNLKLSQSNEMIESSTDEMKKLAEDDAHGIQSEIDKSQNALNDLIAKEKNAPDPNDSKNAIIEIRAGAGGDESSLFASDLFRMYSNYAKSKGLDIVILSQQRETNLSVHSNGKVVFTGYKEFR